MLASLFKKIRQLFDPEVLPLFLFLLIPAVVQALLGDRYKAEFFAATAVYLVNLKWIGATVLQLKYKDKITQARFAYEIFAGIAILCGWFYIRNLFALLAPSLYSLIELKLLSYVLIPAHVIYACLQLRYKDKIFDFSFQSLVSAILSRAIVYGTYSLLLALTLWQIAGSHNPQSSDPIFHAFSSRVFATVGIFGQKFDGGTLLYPSGFGAVNAIAVSISPLVPAQAINLQHIAATITALFVTTSLVVLFDAGLLWVYLLIPLFLAYLPSHSISPHLAYEGAPRQFAAPLIMTILSGAVLSRIASVTFSTPLYLVQTLLAALGVILNPSCILFVLLAYSVSLLSAFQQSLANGAIRTKFVLLSLTLSLIVFSIFILIDPYFWGLLTSSSSQIKVPTSNASSASSIFSTLLVNFLNLRWQSFSRFSEGHFALSGLSFGSLPLIAICAAFLALLISLLRKKTRDLANYGMGFLLFFIIIKAAISTLESSIQPLTPQLFLLKAYLPFVLLRVEMLVVFAILVCAFSSLYLAALTLLPLRPKALNPMVLGLASLCTIATLYFDSVKLSGAQSLRVPLTNAFGLIDPGDIELVNWINSNIKESGGYIGLASLPFEVPGEKHLYPLAGSQALLLAGKHYNFCFFQADPGCGAGFDDYVAHIRTSFDPEWCLAKNINYFFIPKAALGINPGLKDAIKKKSLIKEKCSRSSCLYKVVVMPPTPAIQP